MSHPPSSIPPYRLSPPPHPFSLSPTSFPPSPHLIPAATTTPLSPHHHHLTLLLLQLVPLLALTAPSSLPLYSPLGQTFYSLHPIMKVDRTFPCELLEKVIEQLKKLWKKLWGRKG